MTYRERYPVTLFCWERGTADTLFFLQNQPLSTAQQASSVLRAGARSGLRVAPPAAPSWQGPHVLVPTLLFGALLGLATM